MAPGGGRSGEGHERNGEPPESAGADARAAVSFGGSPKTRERQRRQSGADENRGGKAPRAGRAEPWQEPEPSGERTRDGADRVERVRGADVPSDFGPTFAEECDECRELDP